MTRFYLAHPIGTRHEVRAWELEFEKRTGIELANPFYDTARTDIIAIDRGEKTPFSETLDPIGIVEADLDMIDKGDGLVALVNKDVPSIGTFMEAWYAAMDADMPVYIISPNWFTHPWLRYVADQSGGFIVKTREEFEERIK